VSLSGASYCVRHDYNNYNDDEVDYNRWVKITLLANFKRECDLDSIPYNDDNMTLLLSILPFHPLTCDHLHKCSYGSVKEREQIGCFLHVT
jgi:hypothetical protein